MWPFWFVAVLDASFIPVAGQRPTSAANPPAPLLLSIDRTDRLTDGRTDTRSFYDAYRIRRRPRNNHHEVLFQRTLSAPVRLSAFFLLFPGSPGRAAGFTRTRIEAAAAAAAETLLIIARSRETLNAARLISASTRSKAGRINSFRAVCLRQPPQRISRQSGVKFAAFHRPRTGGGDNY